MHLNCVVMKQRYINYNLHYLFYAFVVYRPRYSASTIVSIEELNTGRTGKGFVGDIMEIYDRYIDIKNKSRRILHDEMTCDNGMMIFKLIFPTHFIQKHEQNILSRNGLSIV